MTTANRDAAWADLTSATALLDGLRHSQVDPAEIVPGAHPSSRWTEAEQALLDDIEQALDVLDPLHPCEDWRARQALALLSQAGRVLDQDAAVAGAVRALRPRAVRR